VPFHSECAVPARAQKDGQTILFCAGRSAGHHADPETDGEHGLPVGEQLEVSCGYALDAAKAMDAYRARPAYQQNDYIGYITRAKLAATREKRIGQMVDELKSGGVYMKMKWNG
jgi:uncharacterized protein YdeI (YjbR/CyaY-like superfamily)